MKRKASASMLAFGLFALVSGCCSPPALSSVEVNLIPQHRDWWCWAATTEMITGYYGHQIDQCESANYIHGIPPDCCTGCTGDCPGWGSDWGARISDIQNNWTHWDFDYTYEASSLSWDKLKQTISTSTNCGRSPIQVVWWWAGGAGHVVTAYGYTETADGNYVAYRNPWPPDCDEPEGAEDECTPVIGGEDAVSTYAVFVNNGIRSWGNSFHHFRYTGP